MAQLGRRQLPKPNPQAMIVAGLNTVYLVSACAQGIAHKRSISVLSNGSPMVSRTTFMFTAPAPLHGRFKKMVDKFHGVGKLASQPSWLVLDTR